LLCWINVLIDWYWKQAGKLGLEPRLLCRVQ